MTDLTLAQQQDTQALVAKQMTQDIAEAHEAMGSDSSIWICK